MTHAAARAYLDTCIVSGIAKGDLSEDELLALERIVDAWTSGRVSLLASSVLRDELQKIPAAHRAKHVAIYDRLANVPFVMPYVRPSALIQGSILSATWSEDPVFTQLRNLLRDPPDAEHAWQASEAGVRFLITVDGRTFLKHRIEVARLCGVELMLPTEFARQELGSSEAG